MPMHGNCHRKEGSTELHAAVAFPVSSEAFASLAESSSNRSDDGLTPQGRSSTNIQGILEVEPPCFESQEFLRCFAYPTH